MISANLAAVFYLVSGILFILALRGLSSPDTSRQGNYFGILGMIIAVFVTFLSVGNFSNSLIYVLFFILISGKAISADLSVIGITEITSGVDVRNYREYKNSKAGNFQTMLETQMVKVGRFKIMERNRLDEVLSEQGLQGEFSDAGTVMNVGAVDYLVYGSITKFGQKQKGT